eukprot:2520179-Rhodomonas_salina.1
MGGLVLSSRGSQRAGTKIAYAATSRTGMGSAYQALIWPYETRSGSILGYVPKSMTKKRELDFAYASQTVCSAISLLASYP